MANRLDIGESVDTVQPILEQHEKFEAKTRVSAIVNRLSYMCKVERDTLRSKTV